MSGFHASWFSLPARLGLLSVVLFAFVLTGAVLSRATLPASVAVAVTTPAASALAQPAAPEWPRTVLRVWILAPLLLPHDR